MENLADQNVDVSVVIPSYNQRHYIEKVLDSLQEQQTRYRYEVIVVDSGTDHSDELVKDKYPWVKLIRLQERAHPGKGRNVGVEQAQSDIIAFTDTDCRLDKTWIESSVSAIKNGSKIVTGPVKNGTPFSIFGTLEYLLEFYDSFDIINGEKKGPVPTLNVIYHKSILEKFGPFDDYVKGSDSRLSRRALDAGEKIIFEPQMRVWHHNRTALKKVLKNQYDLGKGAARTSQEYTLHGRVLTKYPVLIPLIPLIKSWRIGWILARKCIKIFGLYILWYPLVLVGLCAYGRGYANGVKGD